MTRRLSQSSRGYFAIGIWHAKHGVNVGSLWRSASVFGAAFVFTVGRRYEPQASDTPRTPQSVPLQHFADLDDLIGHLPWSCPLVGAETGEASAPLSRFAHPLRAAYLLGAEDHGLPPAVTRRCHYLVRAESPVPWSLNVACAGSIVMHDRYAKTLAMTEQGAA